MKRVRRACFAMGVAAAVGAMRATAENPPYNSDGPRASIWISPEDLAALPDWGSAWESLVAYAAVPNQTPKIADFASNTDVRIMAKALVAARTSDKALK